jgi:hypothetical protein
MALNKVTLLTLSAALILAATERADEPHTFVTTKGDRFERAHVTEVTPATITIVHAVGIAHVPLSELPADVQKRFNYDPDKAKAWLDQIAREEELRRDQEQTARAAAEKQAVEEKRRNREAVDQISHYLDDGGRLEYDPVTHQFYDPDIAAARRRQAFKFYQRYGYWPVPP